jgi:Ca2+-dependent lipid-binding protein
MEPGKLSPEINSYALVRLGKDVFHTRSSSSTNPIWNESFDFPVPDNDFENFTIEIYDTNRGP